MDKVSQQVNSLTQILEELISKTDHEKITVAEILDHLNNRGFGPLLAILGFFVIIIGAIPLVPAFVSLIIIFINLQMLINKKYPWLPKQIRDLKIDKSKIKHGISFIKPFSQKVQPLLRMRWSFLFNRISKIITSLTCIALAAIIIVIGFIPFLPAILAVPIILFGIGYMAQDGLLIALGFLIVFAVSGFFLLQMAPF
jgi:hypothetical protein